MKFLLSFLLFLPLILKAQDETKYHGQIEAVFLNNKQEIIKTIPYSISTDVTYSKFYKSYHIFSEVENGYNTRELNFVNDNKDGTLRYVDTKENKMESKYYSLTNRITIDKTLLLIEEKTYDNFIVVWRVYNLVEITK